MSRTTLLVGFLCGIAYGIDTADRTQAESIPRSSLQEKRFEELIAKYPDMTYEQLAKEYPQRDYVEHLSFDPRQAKFYDATVDALQLDDAEVDTLQKRGFVSVDHAQRYSFGSIYYAVYTRDLPVFITTDSILHAMHRSYDDILMEMEQTFLTAALEDMLAKCHAELAVAAPTSGAAVENYMDVDLYLTVARNLLSGAGAPAGKPTTPFTDAWDGRVSIASKLQKDDEVRKLLDLVQSLRLQSLREGEVTSIYGGKRAIDYSQFKPRGHYTHSAALSRYFRTMMWLGRADAGFNVLPPDPQSGVVSDSPRELRDAVLLTRLLQSSGAAEQLRQINEILDFMVGESDSLTSVQINDLLAAQGIRRSNDLPSVRQIETLQTQLRDNRLTEQRIRSQIVVSDPLDLHQVAPPRVFQLFGQRFAVDSFVLSKVVYDSIIFDGQKVRRHMPSGIDVMFALGNDTVLPLLERGMREFPYASNLKASREFVRQYQPSFWRINLYNLWLDALRTLDADQSLAAHAPEVMRTQAWQRKQLQTQLASWSELRHDAVLYSAQSYTASEKCEYPTGFVEPYPETYARVKLFATEAARRISTADFSKLGTVVADKQKKQVAFFENMADTLGKLETLAEKELAAEPFDGEDRAWIKKAIDSRGGGSGAPSYDGWYAKLFYGGGYRCAAWEPSAIDVHTDPDSKSVLEEGNGSCNFLAIAIDNETDRMIYVGPAYSFYEFEQPAQDRLTDDAWQQLLSTDREPPRSPWTTDFQGPKLRRNLQLPVRH